MESRARAGVLELGNLGGRGALAVWEIQSEGGESQKCLPSIRGCVYFFWNNPFTALTYMYPMKTWLIIAVKQLKQL